MKSALTSTRTLLAAASGKTIAITAAVAALAGAALTVRALTQRAQREHPPQGQFITVNGVRLHYLQRGPLDTTEAIVLVHGNGVMAEDFALAGTLDATPGQRVIAFDRPGYGYSTRPSSTRWTPEAQARLLSNALRQMGVQRATVLGHSWGTLVAVAMGLQDPALVQRLVLLSGYYFLTPRMDAVLMATPALPGIGTLMRHTVSPLMGRLLWPLMMRMMFGPSRVSESFANFPRGLALRPSQLQASAAESMGMLTAAFRLRRHYGRLHMPVSIIGGARDRIVSTEWQSARLHRTVQGSQLTRVQGQGHMLPHLSPQVVAAALQPVARIAGDGVPRDATQPQSFQGEQGQWRWGDASAG